MSPNRELEFILKAQKLREAGYLENYVQDKLKIWGLSEAEAQQVISKSKTQYFPQPAFGASIAPELPRKLKTKPQSKPALERFIDKYFILRRDFAFNGNASPDKLIKILERDTLINNPPGRISAEFSPLQDGDLNFELRLEEPNRYGAYIATAKAEGIISANPEPKSCHIKGTASISDPGRWVFISIVFMSMFGIFVYIQYEVPVPPAFFALPLVGMAFLFSVVWLAMYASRNRIIKIIQDALKTAETEA